MYVTDKFLFGWEVSENKPHENVVQYMYYHH